ncbi:S-adenosyl-L-methionine-dependent methyltransferase [Whalleya microplaca]|nr:S-adenosyl-L-methionine-dependent methyltransferase [Whalleya microplaca]
MTSCMNTDGYGKDDIISYIGPTLDRHKGCDIIDINPGAGLWSQKLHEYLQPRSHLLMEPDADLYKPFLEPLLGRPGTTLIPESGLIWRDLMSFLTPENLPHQVVSDPSHLSQRNDTLLVTANLSFHPRKRMRNFSSLAALILRQFIDAIRSGSLFQRYGLVRMLVWVPPDDKTALLPKCMQKRRRAAVETELYCEWVREVCGRPGDDSSWYIREEALDKSSNLAAYQRMQAAGLEMPADREPPALKATRSASMAGQIKAPGSVQPSFKKPYHEMLGKLADKSLVKGSSNYKAMQELQWRSNWEDRKYQWMHSLIEEYGAITALYKSGNASPKEIEASEARWNENLDAKAQGFVEEFITYKDNLHCYRQDPPLLHWDRREYEPMVVQPQEFFPSVECSLLDIQPKEVHPLMRESGANSNRAGDDFGLIMSAAMAQGTAPMEHVLNMVTPGAADYILPRWTSARDPDRGGVVVKSRYTKLTPRLLNARQWEELLELWAQWPFKPQFHELVGRILGHSLHDETEERDA